MKSFDEFYESLWANIHKKRQRIKRGSGERMRKKGEKGAPTPAQMQRAKDASEDHTAVHGTNQDQAKEREKLKQDVMRRKAQMKRDHENQDRRAIQQDADRKERQIQREAPSLAVLKKKIKSGTKLGSTETASAKARGLIPRADGTKRKSDKYKQETIMTNWIKKRMKERTSWDGAVCIGLGLMILFLTPIAKIAAGLAIAYGVWTIWKSE